MSGEKSPLPVHERLHQEQLKKLKRGFENENMQFNTTSRNRCTLMSTRSKEEVSSSLYKDFFERKDKLKTL